MNTVTTTAGVWACGKARRLFARGSDGKGVYRVGYTLFAPHPAERCTIEFVASKPGEALTEIYKSCKCPTEFHGHEFA